MRGYLHNFIPHLILVSYTILLASIHTKLIHIYYTLLPKHGLLAYSYKEMR